MGQTVLINENFDSYAVGTDISTVSPYFSPWPGGGSTIVSSTYAHSGANSLEFIATGAGGGPTDLLLLLGNQTSGVFGLSWWMYVPAGFGGYFNVQHTEEVTPPEFTAEVIFEDGGNISGTANATPITGTYAQDTWFQVILAVDLNNITAALAIDLTPIATWPINTETDGTVSTNQLGSIDFYAYGGGAPTIGTYYIDDVLYSQLDVGIDEIGGADLATYPNPAMDHLYVEVPNGGSTPQVMLSDASGRVVAESRSFTTIGEKLQLKLDMSTLPSGVYTLRMTDGTSTLTRKVVKG